MRSRLLTGLLVLASLQACTTKPDTLHMLVGTFTQGHDAQGVYLFEFNQDDASYSLIDTAWTENPTFVIPSADRTHAYAVREFGDGTQGACALSLSEDNIDVINLQSVDGEASGAAPCNIIEVGHNIITSNYSGGTISVFPIASDGSLKPMSQQYIPDNSDSGVQSHMHCAVLSPEGRYLFVTDLGADVLYRFTLEDSDTPLQEMKIAYQFDREMHPGPRHMTFSADGRFAYLISELGDYLSVFSYSDGELSHISTELAYDGEGHGSADIHLTPDGKYLYCSHRLKEDGISIFSVHSGTGKASKLAYVKTGIHPRNFNITPNGKYLLCACRDSDRIEIYAINQDGTLTESGKAIDLPAPMCVKFF